MNIGLRLHDAKGDTLREKLDSASAQGFSCAHIAISKIVKGFTMPNAPALLTESYAKEFRADCDASGVSPVLLGCYLNLATPDQEELRWTLDCYRAHLRFAAMLGGGVMVGTETGAPNSAYRTEPKCFTDEALALFIERVRPLAQYAGELGVTLAIEPVVRHIVSTPERARRVLDAVSLGSLRVIFDPVNLLEEANASQADGIFADFIRLLGNDTRLIHIKDYHMPEVTSAPIGQGDMDYRRVLRFAKEKGLPMTLEDTKPENAEEARVYLEHVAL